MLNILLSVEMLFESPIASAGSSLTCFALPEIRRLTHTNVVAFPPAVVARTILGRLGLRRRHGTDFQVHARALNRALISAYRLEAAVLRHVGRLPVGVSIAALATTTAA